MMLRLFIFIAVLALPTIAKADYFLWQDDKTGLSMTFPDTWKMQNNAAADTIMTVGGPSDTAQPVCRIDARSDKRYVIFPVEYNDAVQKVAVSKPFWDKYLSQYDGYSLGGVYDNAGLGKGNASFAVASYKTSLGTVLQSRRAIMFASLYGDKLYVVECSALAHGYDRWEMDFRGIIKSIDFKKHYHELPTGEYANFLKDAELYFWSPSGPEGTIVY
jgi:hypothetical protein